MRFLVAFVSICCLAQGTLEDYRRSAESLDRVRKAGMVTVDSAQAIGKSNRFWYRRGNSEFIVVDASTGAKSPAFDAGKLAAALTVASGTKVNAENLGFTSIEFMNDNAMEFVAQESRWRVNLTTYACEKLPLRQGDSRVIRTLPGPRVQELDHAMSSLDGKWDALIRNHNVWIRARGAKEAVPLSFDGSEGNYYALSNTAWSPDSKKLAVYRVRPGQRRKIAYIESSPDDQVQPKSSFMEYAKPGDALDIPVPVLFDVNARKAFAIDNALFANPYSMSRFLWRKDSRAFTFEYNQRGHQVYRVVEVDALTGAARALVEERSPTFYCYYSKRFVHHADDGRELIWMSERDGWNHLYLYDGAEVDAHCAYVDGRASG